MIIFGSGSTRPLGYAAIFLIGGGEGGYFNYADHPLFIRIVVFDYKFHDVAEILAKTITTTKTSNMN